MSGKSSSSSSKGGEYTVTGSGTNSSGNHYCNREYSNGSGYHYSNTNGSYYYSNPNGSTYYNNGREVMSGRRTRVSPLSSQRRVYESFS
uniref:Uncharacterized protein n=1 Tax=Mycena chlorophos TaxID=658473 RepID=A0ABQ0M1Z4_MYCCL|nr:predicted protein [Mycena chlorophos]